MSSNNFASLISKKTSTDIRNTIRLLLWASFKLAEMKSNEEEIFTHFSFAYSAAMTTAQSAGAVEYTDWFSAEV